MSNLLKKALSPTIEQEIKEVFIKNSLTAELGRAIRHLQKENIDKSGPVYDGEGLSYTCTCLEAIFIHGIKDKFATKVSAVLSGTVDRMPEIDFWPVVMVCSHKDVLKQIRKLSQITTDVGRCRAWLRMALNEGLITSYVEAILQDKATLHSYYRSTAYLRDLEEPAIMKQYLDGLDVFSFKLSFDTTVLNSWTRAPLVLAGLWIPPEVPEPVMPAVDVEDFFQNEETKEQKHSNKSAKFIDKKNEFIVGCDNKSSQLQHLASAQVTDTIAADQSEDLREIEQVDEESVTLSLKWSGVDEDVSTLESPSSVPDLETVLESSPVASGNNLSRQQGWSSSFDEQQTKADDNQSYDSLLQSYNQHRSRMLIGTPEMSDFINSVVTVDTIEDTEVKEKELESSASSCSSEPSSLEAMEFEVIPKVYALTSDHSDQRTQFLLSVLGKICPEQGLDSQNYQCHGCGRPIGMIYGKAHVCTYDGHNYCYECHENEEHVIPARVLLNWDFQKYPVAKLTKIFLNRVEQEPLLDVRILNPLLYSVVEELAALQTLRTQLSFLRSYLFTCRESVAEELRKRVWPREYLYEHVHLYSLVDLQQVNNGILSQHLYKAVNFALNHVLHCPLCSQKGFICELCNNPRVIYPFETDVTYRCEKCLAVYHNACMTEKKHCPKCDRRKQREEPRI
ncbi:uncharacterized protein LOC143226199 [Tachypleus tridentatus]|uniref:uncharacterized protein LOC143226199 n=1 Tax=Tachypleus tridentatus TaxID=6853 RepID=UPI003FD16965